MSLFRRLAHEPLIHFLVVGALLYGSIVLIKGPQLLPADNTSITVDRDVLLTFMQYRSNAFDANAFEQALDNMSEPELQALIDDYVTEEVLYREARSLNLESSDYIIRQRMVQKMQFLLADLAGGESSYSEEELENYFTANREVWKVLPSATFTHVYFDATRRGTEQARLDAEIQRDTFNSLGTGFSDTVGEGDRFPFLKNYVERTFEYLQGQFGTEFVDSLQALEQSDQWQGPLQSAFGWHIVLLTDSQPARYPALEEVREQVVNDFMRERSESLFQDMTESVKTRYSVHTDSLTNTAPDSAP